MKRICTLFHDREVPNAYRVEYIDPDGGCEVAMFSGPDADVRACVFASAIDGPYDGWEDPEDVSRNGEIWREPRSWGHNISPIHS